MSYSVQNIRNVCLLGHSGSGKTSLAESLLFMTGAIDRMGRVADGNTVCDYDPEEVKRQISLSTAVAPIDYKGCRINVLDTPGAFDFSGEVMEALRAADAAIIVCSAKDGVSVGLEKAWKYCEERNMPRFIYISKTDEENADYAAPTVGEQGGEGEGAAGETGVSAPVAVGASPSAISSQNPQPVDFIGQRVALLARENKLTPRETEVFGLLAHGRSIPYVRDALIISRDTAATHAKHIYAKLDVHSRQELIDLVMSDEL